MWVRVLRGTLRASWGPSSTPRRKNFHRNFIEFWTLLNHEGKWGEWGCLGACQGQSGDLLAFGVDEHQFLPPLPRLRADPPESHSTCSHAGHEDISDDQQYWRMINRM